MEEQNTTDRVGWSEKEMEVVLNWITTEGNYAYYRGNGEGVKKKHIVETLSLKIAEASEGIHRSPKNISNKIQHLEKSFRKAFNFQFKETGAGLLENDPASFHTALINMCPYYEVLHPIMSDRIATAPRMTSDGFYGHVVNDLSYNGFIENEPVAATATADNDDGEEEEGEKEEDVSRLNDDGEVSVDNNNQEMAAQATVPIISTPLNISSTMGSAVKKMSVFIPNSSICLRAARVKKAPTTDAVPTGDIMQMLLSAKEEQKRHYATIEKIETEKLKRERLQYKMELIETYKKARLSMTDGEIVQFFPEMQEFIDLIGASKNGSN